MKKNIKYLIPIFTVIVLFVIYAIYNVIVCGKDGCNNLRIKNSKFCSKHTCSNENCFNEKIPGFDICYSCFEENSNEEEYTLTDNQLQQAHNTINEYCNNLMEKQNNILAINKESVNWNQVKIDTAINVMNAILSSSIMVFIFQFVFKKQIAVSYADKLVEELKKQRK